MSLQDSTSKMSKSDTNQSATIYLLDTEEQIREKIKKAVTDSGSKISKDEGSAAISNLLTIYSSFKNQSLVDSLNELDGKSYSEFKALLADVLLQKLSKIQKKYQEIRADEATLRKILDEGREYATGKSSETLAKVKELVGL
jgi:tryptophanyl-tRNA synthetase